MVQIPFVPPAPSATLTAIYDAYEQSQGDGFRDHLGASLIGKSCSRALWFDFRWVTLAKLSGRILRLFETGQLEEARLVRNLRSIGATVLEVDPETGRQFRVEAHGGHFAGSLDALVLGLPEAPKTWHVAEFKTHAIKSFADLTAKGVVASKPQHAAQMQVYMHLTGTTRALYVAVCKDTDMLHVERVMADPDEGKHLLAKAGRIIHGAHPPGRISEYPSWFECRLCSHHDVCHADRTAVVNCRTCLHASVVEGGWHCARHDRMLNFADQHAACTKHLFIPDLVAGEVIDAGDDFVAYRRKDGAVWINDARHSEVRPC